jgi:hypothetical protein
MDILGSLFRYVSQKTINGEFPHYVVETELTKHRVPAQKLNTGTRQT